jgi:hypothetical protein
MIHVLNSHIRAAQTGVFVLEIGILNRHLSMSALHVRPKLALNPETSKRESTLSEPPY